MVGSGIAPLLMVSAGCSSAVDTPEETVRGESAAQPMREIVATTPLSKGADVSWLSEMEDKGIKFYYDNSQEGDCMKILKSLGVNAFRFRVWVNPSGSYSDLPDLLGLCRRAKALGADIMVDLHYSDTWADPASQSVPAAWRGLDLNALEKKVSEYTAEVCEALKKEGISPKWVQIGNETGNGFLWPLGKADTNPAGYARLNNAGQDAVKGVFPQAKTVVHIQNAQNLENAVWIFDLLRANGGRYDVCGFSLYPEQKNYKEMAEKGLSTLRECSIRYGKETMLCEVGMGVAYVEECKDFLKLCLDYSQTLGDKYLGVFYWEPEAYGGWNGYLKGAFSDNGRPTAALTAFGGDSGVREVAAD